MAALLRTALMLVLLPLLAACGDSTGPGPAAQATQQTQVTTAPGEVPVEQLLAQANAAVEAKQLFDPPEHNALALFLEVAEREVTAGAETGKRRRLMDSVGVTAPQQQARIALNELLPFGLARVEQALRAGDLADANRILKLLERAQPDASSAERLRASYDKAYAAWRASLRSTDFDALPPLVSKRMPDYPPRAERRGIEGWVHVAFEIQPDGSVAKVQVLASEPERTFDRAAAKAVEQWRFQQPGRVIRAQRRIEFDLDGSDV